MNDRTRGSFRYGLIIVLSGFASIVILNLLTLELGPSKVLANYVQGNHPWGILLSFSVFDSWGSIIGLLGVIPLFVPILIGKKDRHKIRVSTFFVGASMVLGILASVVWDMLHESTGISVAYGASGIAIVALSIIFSESCILITQTLRATERASSSTRSALIIVYLTLILTSLWFVLFIQPIFIPSNQYNWQVHEFGFGIGIISTLVFEYLISIERYHDNLRRLNPLL